ncbi:MAG TPA: gephyrin-like molybdotransferase Glp [Telmatospirillum sp.]|nr:gephyrin-like molybdotransferase Glp [Telmatospirillum sp.]
MTIQDCFTPPKALITLDQAMVFLTERLDPVVSTERVAVTDAEHRVLAEDIVAPLSNPRAACSAMDGYAFASADLSATGPEVALRLTARIAAGHPHQGRFGSGEAARIFTGAVMPTDFDSVAMQEDCRVEDDLVYVPSQTRPGDWVRPVGQDYVDGTVVLRQGRRLRPQDVAMAASVGRTELMVCRRLRVGVFSTGDEVAEPGQVLAEGQVFGCNRQGILAMVRGLGCEAEDLGNIPDRFDLTKDCLAAASDRCDLLITSGGVSVGGEDHVRAAVESLGAIHLWRMAIKPGKPAALGHVGRSVFIGLPGYPVSSLVTLMMIARPVILRLAGAVAESPHPWRYPVRAAFSFDKRDKRREFIRVSLRTGDDGRPEALLYRSQESNVLSSLVETDGLVDLREETHHVASGDLVDFIPYSALQW